MMQLGTEDAERITQVDEGNAYWVLGETDKGNRIETQWDGRTRHTAYIINTLTGERKTVFKNLYANAEPSPAGNFVYWYSPELKNYFTYELATGITRNVTEKIKVPLYEEDNDVPDFASPYGIMGWQEGDSAVFVYDQFGFWKITDLTSKLNTRKWFLFYDKKEKVASTSRLVYRYIKLNREERYFKAGQEMAFRVFSKEQNKTNTYAFHINDSSVTQSWEIGKEQMPFFNYNGLVKSKESAAFIYSKESFAITPDLYCSKQDLLYPPIKDKRLSDINPQQNDYNWLTAELFKWKAYNGKEATGIVYKPEDFDPKKKYPLICYFYEKLSDGLYNYQSPAPTPSRLNIPFFVSRGYIVLAPDIEYSIGHPGNSAYNYVASGARALVKAGFVDSTKMGIQGQSWGGYQVAYLITKTKMFKAAWAGAPVANMTSAYGGIRWESGLNRQFQYEKQQSRIGATLWEKPQLYIENSPLFHLNKVQTPLVIMHNDADGAVPWYQGIELFTALRRLGKPVWMLNYNNEAHNLMERRNRKDIQIREQQFFDWQLKGEKATKWLTEGIPATSKGREWGLQVE
jgi:dipeptidyl aminopeptidase/acylaminoacyl peptidase